MSSHDVLSRATESLIRHTGLLPRMAVEIEFYLWSDQPSLHPSAFLKALKTWCDTQDIALVAIDKEKGHGQFELVLSPVLSPIELADKILRIRDYLPTLAQGHQCEASTASFPFSDQPANSMHVHVSLLTHEGKNPMTKTADDEESDIMLYSISGLLDTMREHMPIFVPDEAGYRRFTTPSPHTPTTISWGGNNRTTALRIPASSFVYKHNRHIEHRIPSSECDPYAIFAAILSGIEHGITRHQPPATQKIYGNASDPQYRAMPYCLGALTACKV